MKQRKIKIPIRKAKNPKKYKYLNNINATICLTSDIELKTLGFVSDKGVAGCCTLPTCFQGKKPYEKGKTTACAIIRSMCSTSPVEQMRECKQ